MALSDFVFVHTLSFSISSSAQHTCASGFCHPFSSFTLDFVVFVPLLTFYQSFDFLPPWSSDFFSVLSWSVIDFFYRSFPSLLFGIVSSHLSSVLCWLFSFVFLSVHKSSFGFGPVFSFLYVVSFTQRATTISLWGDLQVCHSSPDLFFSVDLYLNLSVESPFQKVSTKLELNVSKN